MSVDVFGRKLDKKEGSRGPPGVGYKITEDGQYDADNKRISNVAYPHKANDAVNLDFLSQLIEAEIHTLKSEITRMQKNIKDLEFDMKKQYNEFLKYIKKE